jgi:hypothetical protein
MSLIDELNDALNSAASEIERSVTNLSGEIDINGKLEEIALPLAQSWKSDHPNAQPGSASDFDDCVTIVAAGTAAGATIAASSLGPWGTALGAAVGAGGGIAAARIVCRRVIG